MSDIHKASKLVRSVRLLDAKIKNASYWTLNGKLHPSIKRQILSVISQAKAIDESKL